MRYLFVTVDGGGNVQPELALAHRLRTRGHTVRFLASSSQREAIEDAGFPLSTFRVAPDLDTTHRDRSPIKDWVDDPQTVFTALCESIWFGPAAAFARDVLHQIEQDAVDVLVVDYFLPGALIGAEKAGVPCVALWHTTFGEWESWNQGLPALNTARADLDLAPVTSVFEQYRRADRVLILTSEHFDFACATQPMPGNARHVGPQFADISTVIPRATPTGTDEEVPLVLVSLSTSYQGQEDLLRRVVDALGSLPVRALVTTGPAVDFDAPTPGNVEIRRWIPHSDVLPHAALVVTHAGLGTVMAAAAHGVPMVCLPMGRDQHGNAERVARLGAGTVLAATSTPAQIADAVANAVEDPALDANAKRFALLLAAELTRDEAVLELENLPALRSRRVRPKDGSDP